MPRKAVRTPQEQVKRVVGGSLESTPLAELYTAWAYRLNHDEPYVSAGPFSDLRSDLPAVIVVLPQGADQAKFIDELAVWLASR